MQDADLVSIPLIGVKSGALEVLKESSNRDHFQSAVASYITNMFVESEDLEELRRVFDRADTDNSGTLSQEELA